MKSSESVSHKCPSCNAVLTFSPKKQLWQCEYCGQEFKLEDLKINQEKYNKKETKEVEEIDVLTEGDYDLYRCSNCGAELVTDKDTTATFCVYCKNTAIIKDRLVGKFEPELIIPFNKTLDEAKEEFVKLRKKYLLMPNEFAKKENIEEIRGIYIPFWLFSGSSEGGIDATGTKVKVWHSGDYRYEKTDTYQIIREGNIFIERVPNDGAIKFDDALMNSIEPFDYSKLVDFNPSYLSGFLSEKYDLSSEEAKKIATKRMKETVKKTLVNDVKGFGAIKINRNYIKFPKIDVEYALLPVYLLNIKYKGKLYPYAMNGESGKLIGDIPRDPLKVILFLLVITLVSFAIFFAFFWLFIRGDVR